MQPWRTRRNMSSSRTRPHFDRAKQSQRGALRKVQRTLVLRRKEFQYDFVEREPDAMTSGPVHFHRFHREFSLRAGAFSFRTASIAKFHSAHWQQQTRRAKLGTVDTDASDVKRWRQTRQPQSRHCTLSTRSTMSVQHPLR